MTNDEDIKKKFKDYNEKFKKTSLQINRIPEKYKTRFMQISKEEFSNDYGMCLREMIRTWDGNFVNPNEELSTKIDTIATEQGNIRTEFEEIKALANEKPKEVQMADGTKRRTGV